MFLKFFKDLPKSFYVTLVSILSINQDIIKVYNDKIIKDFY